MKRDLCVLLAAGGALKVMAGADAWKMSGWTNSSYPDREAIKMRNGLRVAAAMGAFLLVLSGLIQGANGE